MCDSVEKLELELYQAIQDHLIQEYDCTGISIEACPSSNVYIGRINDYAEHPIFRWRPPKEHWSQDNKNNQFGLRTGPIRVCINTDDPGIFPTTIRNEHRIMKEVTIEHYELTQEQAQSWIDRIRTIGIDEFKQNHFPIAL